MLMFSASIFSACQSTVIKAINVVGDTYETTVLLNADINFEDLDAIVTFDDDTTKHISYSDITIGDVDTSTLGEKIVTLSYNNFEFEIVITVINYPIESIVATVGTFDARILKDDELNLENLTATVTYEDDSTEMIDIADITVGTLDTSTVGEKTLTLTYNDFEFTLTITVSNPAVSSMTVVEDSYNETVVKNCVLDLRDIQFSVVYEDDDTETVNYTKLTLNAIDTSVLGEQTLQVTYKGFTVELTITVIDIAVESSAIKTGTYATSCYTGDDYDITDIILVLTYNNGVVEEIAYADLTVTPFSTETAGEKTLTVTYGEITKTATVNVIQLVVNSSVVKTGTYATSCYTGDDYDFTGIILVLTYNNGVVEEIAYADLTVTPFSTETAGEKNLTVTYGTIEATASVNVIQLVVNSSVIKTGTYATSCYTGDDYDITGIVLVLTYNNAVVQEIAYADLTVTPFSTETAGEKTLTVTYGTIEATASINVILTAVTSIVLSGTYPTIGYTDEALDFSGIEATAYYNNGSHQTLTYADLTLSEETFSTAGTKQITITYDSFSTTLNVTISLNEYDKYLIMGIESQLLTNFNANKAEQANEEEEFYDLSQTLMAGYYNAFSLQIIATGEDSDGVYCDTITKVRTTSVVYMWQYYEGEDQWVEISGETLSTYAEIDNLNNTIQFTFDAVGSFFKIVTSVVKYDPEYFDEAPSFEMIVDVTNGYNVYTAKDLCVIENAGKNGWTEFKEENGYTGINVSSVVLQKNISIKRADVASGLFYTSTEAAAVSEGVTNQAIVGSLKDDFFVYERIVGDGDTFDFYGNYFQVDVSSFPRCVVEAGGGGVIVNNIDTTQETAMVGHSSLLKFYSAKDSTTGEYYSTGSITVCNVSFKGNGQRSARAIYSGGIILFETAVLDAQIINCIYNDFYIGIFTEQSITNGIYVYQVKGYNSYNSLLYAWGTNGLMFENCEFIGAGGPVIIIDHDDNNTTDGSGGNPSYVDIINCNLESWVSGDEPWFAQFGASELVGQLKAANAFYNGTGGLPDTGKTLIKTIDGVQMLNMIAVLKSGNAEGLTTSVIRGKTTIYESREAYDAQNKEINPVVSTYGIDFEKGGSTTAESNLSFKSRTTGNTYFESNSSGGYINSSVSTNGDYTANYYAGDYVNLYLANGMGAILGLNTSSVG